MCEVSLPDTDYKEILYHQLNISQSDSLTLLPSPGDQVRTDRETGIFIALYYLSTYHLVLSTYH